MALLARLHDVERGYICDLEFHSALPRQGDTLHVRKSPDSDPTDSVQYAVGWITWMDRGDFSMTPHIHARRVRARGAGA